MILFLFLALLVAPQPPAQGLDLTMWQLVAIHGGDGKTVTPDDGNKYTISFQPFGSLRVSLDCNRGNGTWKAPGPGQLTIGPLAVTRAFCGQESLSDRILKDIGYAQSYEIKGDRLIMTLGNERGTYEWGPAR